MREGELSLKGQGGDRRACPWELGVSEGHGDSESLSSSLSTAFKSKNAHGTHACCAQ